MSSQSGNLRVCHGCLFSANESEKMMRCSRCHDAIYHNRKCQIKHHPKHKASCRQRAKALQGVLKNDNLNRNSDQCFEAKHISQERGRGLVSLCNAQRGRRVDLYDCSSCRNVGVFSITVLEHAHRSSRCAYCFCKLEEGLVNDEQWGNLYKYCSTECETIDTLGFMERKVARSMNRENIMNRVIPTAVLVIARLFYLLCAEFVSSGSDEMLYAKEGTWYYEVHKLVSNYDRTDKTNQDRYVDLFEISFIWFQRLVLNMDKHVDVINKFFAQLHTNQWGQVIVGKVMMNCFTMFDSSENDVGVAFFPNASTINHSCYPNALQTFVFDKGLKPSIAITLCRDINVGEEVTIPYINLTDAATHERINQLMEGYKFLCKCERCADIYHDDTMIGIRCPKPHCLGSARRCARSILHLGYLMETLSGNSFSWKCDLCGATDFKAVLQIIDDSSQRAKILFNEEFSESNFIEMKSLLKVTKQFCHDTSIYARRIETILSDMINRSMSPDIPHEVMVSKSQIAYSILEHLIGSEDKSIYNYDLDRYYNRIILAKLHLSLFPNLLLLKEMLLSCREQLSIFFAPNNHIMISIEFLLDEIVM